MNFYDCHTHLNYEPLDKNADYIANFCKKNNIILNNIGTNLQTSQASIDLAKKHKNVFACVGIHPNDIDIDGIEKIKNKMEGWLEQKQANKIIAIGETGLDYHYQGYDKQKQFDYLLIHLEFSIKYKLPLMIHVRDAHDDMIAFLKKYKTSNLKVIIHCFTENEGIVKQYIDLDCYISIPGVITFKNAVALKKAIHLIPLNRLLCETDAPWLTPEPYRGKNNTPEYIPYVVDGIAKELQKSKDEIAKTLFDNAVKLFDINSFLI